MAHKRICYICRDNYSYCPQCEEDSMKPAWMFLFCSEKCKKINDILTSHTQDRITTKEAKEKLEKMNFIIADISEKNELDRKHAKEILDYVDKPATPKIKKAVQVENK